MSSTEIGAAFDAAGVAGALHVVDLDGGASISHNADELVVPASVFKLPVLLELCRQDAVGEIDASAPVTLPVAGRAPGPFGVSVMKDPITASLRDLAWLMMGISDNAATDVVCAHVGLDAVRAHLGRLGLTQTRVDGDCRDLFRTVSEDLDEDMSLFMKPTRESLEKLRALDPARSLHATTPREMTSLLALIWRDEAAPADACAETRRILGLQVWPHRLASGFGDLDEVITFGKTGTLPTIRNEVGVVEYPDGGRYAVAVFTRSSSLTQKHPAADVVIGQASRLAVDALRGGRTEARLAESGP
jgi:beta-lactamase class A